MPILPRFYTSLYVFVVSRRGLPSICDVNWPRTSVKMARSGSVIGGTNIQNDGRRYWLYSRGPLDKSKL